MPRAFVIGGGVSGLACGDALAERGYEVTVLEGTPRLGGMAATFTRGEFRFDMGPHKLYTPQPVPMARVRGLFVEGDLLEIPKISQLHFHDRSFRYPLSMGELLGGIPRARALAFGGSFLASRLRRGENGSYAAFMRKQFGGALDVAMIQSLVRKGDVADVVAQYGHVIVDECHHAPAVSFERVLREVKARYITGLTATPYRRDGHHPILHMQLGPIRFAVDPRKAALARPFDQRLIVRETSFLDAPGKDDVSIQDIYRRMAADTGRNRLIVDDVRAALAEGRTPIVLTERRDHLDMLAAELETAADVVVVLHGGMGTKGRRAALARLSEAPDQQTRLILATGRYIGEGFDDARLDTLFLAMPISWRGTLVQYAGRLHRLHPSKREVRIVDYVDRNAPMMARTPRPTRPTTWRRSRCHDSHEEDRAEAPPTLARTPPSSS